MKRFFTKIDSELWLLLALSIFAWGPLLNPAYFFQAHDAQHSIFYLVEFDQTFRDGYLWPRWSPDFAFGYGYPLFNNTIAPLPIYLAELIHLLGFRMITAIKIMYGLSIIGSGWAMYGFVKSLFGRQAGLMAGLVYMIAPFHLLDIYVRSAYAESVSLALLPLILWAFTTLIERPSLRRVALAGGSYGLLALSHSISLFTFTLFLLLYIGLLVAWQARLSIRIWLNQAGVNAAAGVLGLALAGIFILPVILEQRYIKIEQWTSGSYNASQHFVYFSQLFSPFWGYGYSGPGPIDDMSYQIGLIIYGLLIFSLIGLLIFGQKLPHREKVIAGLVMGLLAVWLMSPLAERAWEVLPIAALVQFPWRLLIMVMISFSMVIGGLIASLTIDSTRLGFLTLITLLGSYAYAQPEYTPIPDWAETPLSVIEWDSFSPQDRVGMVAVTTEQPTSSPMEAQYRAGQPLQVAAVISGQAQVETIRHGGASDEIRVSGGPATVQFHTYDFPGWRVRLNGQIISHRPEPPYGLITVDIPAGEHTVLLKMGPTPPRIIGTILSAIALVIILTGIFKVRRDP